MKLIAVAINPGVKNRMIPQIFDFFLVLMIVWLAWRSIADQDLFRSVVNFILFGLLLALAWLRLRAPDIAMAEAAVGSGLAGALILTALSRMRAREAMESKGEKAEQ
jgi:uncharacterized MnhB-related membrane protein